MRHGPWDAIRLMLGLLQMAAATIAAVLLVRLGVTAWSLTAVVLACLLTTVSVLLFGAPRRRLARRFHATGGSRK